MRICVHVTLSYKRQTSESFMEFQPFLIDYTSFNLAQDKDTLVFKIQSCTFKKAYGTLMGFIT